MNENQYINSKLFGVLFEKGGQSLVATYAMLLKGRKGFHYYSPEKKSNNKISKGVRLISEKSQVSITALKKYIPQLIDLDLCYYTADGGFFLRGSKSIKEMFNRHKSVPIKIGKNLRETKGNINAVIIIANIYRQTKQIDKKVTLNKALRKDKKGIPLSKEQSLAILRASKNKNVDLDNLKKVENTVLSNQGFSNVIRAVSREFNSCAVSHGGYWRKVLEKRGFIVSRRRYKEVWNKQMSYDEYLASRNYFYDLYGFVTYKNGRIVKPIVSEVLLQNTSIVDHSVYNTNSIVSIYKNKIGVEVTPPSDS